MENAAQRQADWKKTTRQGIHEEKDEGQGNEQRLMEREGESTRAASQSDSFSADLSLNGPCACAIGELSHRWSYGRVANMIPCLVVRLPTRHAARAYREPNILGPSIISATRA